MIKIQNIQLIKKLSIYKEISETDQNELLDKFIKINYMYPELVSHNKYLKHKNI